MTVVKFKKQKKIPAFTLNRPEARSAINAQGIWHLHNRMVEFNCD